MTNKILDIIIQIESLFFQILCAGDLPVTLLYT